MLLRLVDIGGAQIRGYSGGSLIHSPASADRARMTRTSQLQIV